MRFYNVFNLTVRNSRNSRFIFNFNRNHFQYMNFLKKCENLEYKKLSLVASANFQKPLRKIHEITTNSDELDDLETDFEVEKLDASFDKNYAKNSLYPNSKDPVITTLNECVSVQEVLNTYNAHKHVYTSKHVTQTILVLSDLYRIYSQVADTSRGVNNDFIQQLQLKSEFQEILGYIEKKLFSFNKPELISILFHLISFGLDVCHPLPQLLINHIKDSFLKDFSLSEASIFFTAVFKDPSIRPFLVIQEMIPVLIEQIESCSLEDFEHLTTCLYKIHRIVTLKQLKKYKHRLTSFLDDGRLLPSHKKLILKAISFLSISQWQDECTSLMSKCMSVLQGQLNSLDPYELVLVDEVFFKIKEPGYLLNEIQRCALTYLNKEMDHTTQYQSLHLKLFLSLMFFLSPLQRTQYEKIVRKYVFYCNEYNSDSLLTLAKILSYVRTSDDNLCEILWRAGLRYVKHSEDEKDIFRFCRNYINFHTDLNNYRFPPFEKYTVIQLKKRFNNGYIQYIPSKVVNILSFVLVYGKDKVFLDTLISKLEDNWEQLNAVHCLFLAQSMKIIDTTPNEYFTRFELHRLNKVIDRVVEKELAAAVNDAKKVGMLLKSCVLRDADKGLIMKATKSININKIMSSRTVENVCYCLLQTSILHQELIERCIHYVLSNRNHILAYEAARLLYLSFYLGIQPNNIDEFLDIVINLIIRDQERLTGLTFLQSALALCFYNKLPHSFIKLLFNVEFLEKLDGELANCYSKDKYPQRVRNELMQLNRAVCLMYPEASVPWFHEKYLDIVKNQVMQNLEKQKLFPTRVKTYLSQIVNDPEYINEHVITPYGYHIHFELNFNQEDKLVKPGSTDIKRKVAIILLQPKAFTHLCVQLKGKFQLMMRHLEILGYEVIFINFTEWMNLVYAGQRLDFLSKLIWPRKQNRSPEVINR